MNPTLNGWTGLDPVVGIRGADLRVMPPRCRDEQKTGR